jgi:hypothetical protein
MPVYIPRPLQKFVYQFFYNIQTFLRKRIFNPPQAGCVTQIVPEADPPLAWPVLQFLSFSEVSDDMSQKVWEGRRISYLRP